MPVLHGDSPTQAFTARGAIHLVHVPLTSWCPSGQPPPELSAPGGGRKSRLLTSLGCNGHRILLQSLIARNCSHSKVATNYDFHHCFRIIAHPPTIWQHSVGDLAYVHPTLPRPKYGQSLTTSGLFYSNWILWQIQPQLNLEQSSQLTRWRGCVNITIVKNLSRQAMEKTR